MVNRLAFTVAVGGERYTQAAAALRASFETHNPGVPFRVLTDDRHDLGPVPLSRYLKTSALDMPEDQLLYLDADCLVQEDMSVGWKLLDDGWDLCIVPSPNQDLDAFWHVDRGEVDTTLLEAGFTPLQLQGGCWYVAKNARTLAFFDAWHREWERFKGKDQAALVRALLACPVRVCLLGWPWLRGGVVQHRFGLFRDR